MAAGVPVLAIAALVVLSLVARELNYLLTSASLMFMSGAVAVGLIAVQLIFD